MRRVLVTGASGFIGRHLCRRLKSEQLFVRALMRHEVDGPWDETATADLSADSLPSDATSEIDTVFHLAGKAHALSEVQSDALEYHRVNAEGTSRLLKSAHRHHVERFIFVSSVKAMGDGGHRCIDETFERAPDTPYGVSKREAEQRVLEMAASQGAHAAVLRLPLVYGAGVKGNLSNMLDAIARRRFPPLAATGNIRSLIHVDDVVQAACLAAVRVEACGKIYLVTDGERYSTDEIYRLMANALHRQVPGWTIPDALLRLAAFMGDAIGIVLGRRFVIDSEALQKLTGSAWYSSEKIKAELGFKASRTLETALPEMVAHYYRQVGGQEG